MGVARSNSGLFSTPGFIVSPLGKREMAGGTREGGKKGIEKEWKEGRNEGRKDKRRLEER